MLFLIFATGLFLATLSMVRPALADGPPLALSGLNGASVVIAFTCFVSVGVLMGSVFAFALLLAFLLHEFGHVLAYRMVGHADARFRLVPFWNGVRISDTPPRSDLDAFFIALMGPGVSLAPMVLSFALVDVLAPHAPLASDFFLQFALATGALNFVNLLPLWPLDGGRCIRIMVQAQFPGVGPLAAAAMSAALMGFAYSVSSVLIFLMALVGAFALITGREDHASRATLTKHELRLALTAYFAALSAFFLGGWWIIRIIPMT
ncbi:hypothetical protein [Aliiroseovarius subalbicans]|uniref:hypothetical protein n=1 Tax=Aliiroseovarius subalbicans TaxID=2925840 RepID=UPI001F578CD5|nr:hypothetical protein [Aliiroseovarius subalbicans]MCI2400266.1 hypothetical protein [Aliiroseovarius subalbicans]